MVAKFNYFLIGGSKAASILINLYQPNQPNIKVLKFEIDSMRDGRGIDLLKCPNIGFTSVSKYILVNSTAVPSSVKIFPQYQLLFLQDVLEQ